MMVWIIGPIVALSMLGAGGTRTNDLVSLLDAKDYFAYHKINVSAERMMKLAGEKAESPAAEIQRLLAIRWLGRPADAARKSAKAKQMLEQLAAGKGVQDQLGFVREYAQATRARLEGKAVPAKRSLPPESVRRDALSWFPDSNNLLFGALDVRRAGEVEPLDISPLRAMLIKEIPASAKPAIYEEIDRLGNVRLDRVSFAYQADPKDRQKSKIYIRFTGLGVHKAIVDEMKRVLVFGNIKTEERKGPKGEPITILDGGRFGPGIVVVGDTDLLIAGYAGSGASAEVTDLALDVRAGKKDSIVKGSFADALKDVPATASGLLMGDLPEELRSELTGGGSPFKAVPKTISAILMKDKTLSIKAEGVMANADDATALADNIVQLKTMSIAALGKLPPQLGVTAAQVKMLRQTLESLKAQAKSDGITASMKIPAKVLGLAGDLAVKYLMLESRPTPAPVPR